MEEKKFKILIIGSGAKVSALAKKMKSYPNVEKIYIASGNGFSCDEYVNVDIREDDLTGLLKFVLENNIDLTIPFSKIAIEADVVAFFQTNGQNIFGPCLKSCTSMLNRSLCKKFLYKIRAQISKFGVFDKMQAAHEYLKNSSFPVVIRTAKDTGLNNDEVVCPTMSLSLMFLDELINIRKEAEILIEDFTYGKNFTVYFITDGYTALPVGSCLNFKFSQDDESGNLTNGMGCCTPCGFVSELMLSRISNIVDNIIKSCEKSSSPYIGFIGVECVLTQEDKFVVNDLKLYLQNSDASAILDLIDENLLDLFLSCIHGFFSDDYENIKTNELTAVSAVVTSRKEGCVILGLNKIENIEDVDFISFKTDKNNQYITSSRDEFVLTKTARTLKYAKQLLKNELSEITFTGIKYRKDIFEQKEEY